MLVRVLLISDYDECAMLSEFVLLMFVLPTLLSLFFTGWLIWMNDEETVRDVEMNIFDTNTLSMAHS